MVNVPGAWIAGQTVSGIVDGTVIEGAHFIAYGPQGELLIYSGTPASGNLIGSWSGAAGSDDESNAYPLGLGLQGIGDVLTVIGSGGQMITLTVTGGGVPEIQFETGAAYQSAAGIISMGQSSLDAVDYMYVYVLSPLVTGSTESVAVFLNSGPATGSNFTAGGSLQYTDSSGLAHLPLVWGSSGVQVASPLAGDTNVYQTERLSFSLSSAVPISSSSPTEFMSTFELGVGTYHIHGQISITVNTDGGEAGFEFAGGGGLAASNMGITFQEFVEGSPALIENGVNITALASAFTGETLGTAGRYYKFDGTIVVATAGSCGIFASVSSGEFTINIGGTYIEINPIGS